MRADAFYWKCDNPAPVADKRLGYFADKYTRETDHLARGIFEHFLGKTPSDPERLAVDGNHFTYRCDARGKRYLLRTDDGQGVDDYMLAESAILQDLKARGLPVPAVHATDVTQARFPVRYQIMDFIEAPSLTRYYRDGTLNRPAMSHAFGHFLGALHERTGDGFGFLDTVVLMHEGRFQGIDARWRDYFTKCLANHLGYLRDHALLDERQVHRIETALVRHEKLLARERGSLLHRDFAYWNILGTPDTIEAVIDWDDAVLGDPADDLGIVNCFNSPEFMDRILEAYAERQTVDEAFRLRIHLYTVRNMLWKTMIRHYMGYFDRGDTFFLSTNELNLPLREYSLVKLEHSLEALEQA